MRLARSIAVVSALGLPVFAAHAQSNEAELIAAGAVKMTAQALRDRLVRGTQIGKVLTGAEIRVKNSADGRYSGNALTASGTNAGLFGKWSVDDDGRACADSNFDPKPVCSRYYELSGRYFAIYETDGAKRAFERTFSE